MCIKVSAKQIISKWYRTYYSDNEIDFKDECAFNWSTENSKNIYHPSEPDISETLLDKSTYPIGHYLIKRYLCTNGILGLNEEHLPPITDIEGPKVLLDRVRQ